MGEQAHRALRPQPGALPHQAPGGLGERDVGVPQVVGAAEPHRRRTSRRVEGVAIEQFRKLVQIEQRHEHPVAERVPDRPEAPVADPALIDRRVAHAATARGSASGSAGRARVSCSQARSALHTPSS